MSGDRHDPAELERSDPCEDPVGTDAVATGRALERAAERTLATADLDDRTAREIRTACQQLAADRANGENLDASIDRLRDLLARPGHS